MKKYIIIGLISILIVFGIIMSVKCSRLERENTQLKSEQVTIVDSIRIENESLNKEILLLNNELNKYSHEIDSLKAIKNKVIIQKEYIMSDNLTEGVALLKENLKCER